MRLSGIIVQLNLLCATQDCPAFADGTELLRAITRGGVGLRRATNAPRTRELPMPSDLPATHPVATMPYHRVLAFLAGGGVTLAFLMLISNLLRYPLPNRWTFYLFN
jgi:hypothetical protein